MPLEWQQIHRLLLVCSFSKTAIAQLELAVQILRQNFPEATQTLLTCETDAYAFSTISSRYFDLSNLQMQHLSFDFSKLIFAIAEHAFDAAIIFTQPSQSPYSLAYLCYLANIPIRLGQSSEFGGEVLSPWVKPPIESVSLADYHLHLLKSANFVIDTDLITSYA